MKTRCILPVALAATLAAATTKGATFDIPAGNVAALKDAIAAANSNFATDTINLAAGATYTLTTVDNDSTAGANGLPVIVRDGFNRTRFGLTINGNGATIIRATASGTPEFRILALAANSSVTITNLSVRNGRSTRAGGGIRNDGGSLTLTDCTVAGNSAEPDGGGIYNRGGRVLLRRCTVSSNTASSQSSDPYVSAFASGGGIYNQNGTLDVQLCTFSRNTAVASASGSASAIAWGSAIYNFGFDGAARVTISNSTFSRNGGGGEFPGQAIYNGKQGDTATATIEIGSTILDEDYRALSNAGGVITSAGFNLCNGSGDGFLTAETDRINVDPQLLPLASNGGPTQTHALHTTSPAIDSGKRDAVPALAVTTDQRGAPRPFDQPGAGSVAGSDGSDIGAFEKGAPTLLVTTTADDDNGACTVDHCTLREAIRAANEQPNFDTIAFAPDVTGTILLTAALPALVTDLEIIGPGAGVLEVRRDTGGNYRILTVTGGTAATPSVVVFGLTLSNGRSDGTGAAGGGCILNDRGRLHVERCALVGNIAGDGGALLNSRGVVRVVDTTLSGNSAAGAGGAVSNVALGEVNLTLTNCTLSANSAASGGAIQNNGAADRAGLTLRNCTVAGNSASAGGISNEGTFAGVNLQNTIVSNPAAGSNIVNSGGATVTSEGNNISSDAAGGNSSTAPGGLLNKPGDMRNTDPKLDAAGLQNNGGSTLTIALQPASPAVNTANAAAAPLFDQRGFSRSGPPDIGAFEYAGAGPTPTPVPSATPTPTPAATPTPNRFANISTRLRVETGDNVLIGGFIVTGSMQKKIIVRALGPSLPIEDKLANPVLELYDANAQLIAANDNWQDAPNRQEIIDSTIPPPDDFESAILRDVDLGAYTAVVRDAADDRGIGLVEVYDLGNNQDSKLANISTRGRVLTGDRVMIGGLIVTGSSAQKVIVRAIGPSLGIGGQLEDPLLQLFDGNGNPLGENNNWKETQQAEIEATTIPPGNDLESAIVTSLLPAAYTAVVSGVNGSTGVGLVEVYALP